ncbi:DEAD/DEAH box helicase [Haloprofundus halobius]|uniref:DEAD/DEAH box helicase n=1 Tax=Haloprofundus halobius TaxID=2876194 RepID=UPI001CCE0491|nr:DEAD/DEAH box helicase [Haloprofundus halobius]
MTKLTGIDGISNAQSFVSEELIERKGPFVEFVDAPKFHEQTAAAFLDELGYDETITETIIAELFGGNESGSLYQHQAEMIRQIETTNRDNILAVPTAAGKTEAFFLPILNYCLSTDEEGLKSIILYPMKTLGVDQLNRFITYLDHINRSRDPDDRITIGIWDSDTPQRVGTRSYEVEEGSYIRGLVDPRDESEKLRVLSNTSVGTDDNQYSWIRVTREAIRQGVDILLTVPEALDYMFVSNNDETRGLLGDNPGDQPLKHIVYDEAHVWSGIQGAAVSLLSQRLKAFYAENDPQVTMVSATVDNPRSLAASLAGVETEPADINAVEFTPRGFRINGEPSFDRFAPCDLSDLVHALAVAALDVENAEALVEELDVANGIATLAEVGLVDSDQLTVSSDTPEWAVKPIVRTVAELREQDEFTDADDVLRSKSGRSRIVETVIEESGFTSGWYDYVIDSVPEVAAFTEWFDTGTTGVVGFKAYDALLEDAAERGADVPKGTVETVMAFGRLAGIVTEKYHVFLKPPHRVFWCRRCERLTRDERCSECGDALPEVRFCRTCHEPYVELETEEDEVFVPIDSASRSEHCPGCGGRPKLNDVGVPTSSLLSYMLTEVCHVTPSKKTLVFSDSHSAAESVGDTIIETEYGLMAQTLYLEELIEEGGRADNYDLYVTVASRLQSEYWDPLVQNQIDEDSEAYNFLQPLQKTIRNHAGLSNCDSLLDSALVTGDVVADRSDPVEMTVAHEMYKQFVLNNASFTYNRVSFNGLTRSKLLDRLDDRLTLERGRIDDIVDDVLADMLEAGIVSIMPFDDVKQSVDSSNADGSKLEELRTYLESAREQVNQMGVLDEPADSGIFTRIITKDRSELVLLSEVAFCEECYSSHPVTQDGDAVDRCQHCGNPIYVYRRFSETSDGTLTATPGYADVDSEWEYALDHWAHDVTRPIQNGQSPEFVTVGIHKGNIPHTVRGAIEESFRKEDPDVNIVSSTPTMELGVDIGSLDTVAQVGVPPTLTNYVQRSGRTGRTRGSSSLVMTVVRGQHPVDGHYYANLDSYLGGFEPVRVPHPYDFDELLAGHVATEVFAYLARNPHETNVFMRMYSIPEPERENLTKFVSAVQERLGILTEFITEERADVLREHVDEVFGERGVEVFDRIFLDGGPLSLSTRSEQTFGRLRTMSSGATANRDLTQNASRLDQWLDRLGYLANYRSFGQSFPVKFSGYSDEISFESSGRLYDMYPGEENDLGALVTLHGTDYLVGDVRGTPTALAEVAICDNEECDRRFQSYDTSEVECPHCDSELKTTEVHGIANVECQLARGAQSGWRTHGQMSTYIETIDDGGMETKETTLFGLPCEVEYGQYEITDFVYAFERGHSTSPDTTVIRSEALIEEDESETSSSSGLSWRDRLNEAEAQKYRPVGQQYHTQGLTLRFDRKALEERYNHVSHDTKSWPQALTSLEQALQRAVAIVAECDRSDFRIKSTTTGDTVKISLVDSRQGGNGITWRVQESLTQVGARVDEIADCDCVSYCDECLLLSRTPAHYLENDLLDHRSLAAIIGVASA